MEIFLSLLSFLFGLAIGSFLNVLIWRWDKKLEIDKAKLKLLSFLNFIGGRSFCDFCRKELKWFENIPLLSFVFLKGKCRSCHSPISSEYPLVELITGIIYFLVVYHFFSSGLLLIILYLLIASLLMAIFLFDFHYQIIPDWATVSLVAISFLINLLNKNNFINYLMTGLIFFLFFLLLHLITKGRGMGLGDVKFAFFMGFFLGWPKIIVSFYVAFLTGAIFGVILILLKKKRFGQQIAFGPFLIGATFISWLWGKEIVNIVTKCLRV